MSNDAPTLLHTGAAIDAASHATTPYGRSSQGICKVSNGNVCGSGSLVGKWNGRSLIMTNAHVAGTKVGKQMRCIFPHAGDKVVPCRLIMAAYSDRVMADWAILEADRVLQLPHVKLRNEMPQGEHYTGGYPRCQGPYYQKLTTTRITHGGTVWRWQPNAIGGQSGSGVHSLTDHLQYGILTWSWAGDGAGQTAHSIWVQYANRHAGHPVGFERPEGLVELNDNRADELENGFHQEANVTTLPIWDHMDDGDDDEPDDPTPNPDFARKVITEAEAMAKRASSLAETARRYMDPEDDDTGAPSGNGGGGLFDL